MGFVMALGQLSWLVREGPVLRDMGLGGDRAAALGYLPRHLGELLHL